MDDFVTLSPSENSTDYEYEYEFLFDDYNQHIVIATAFSIAALLGIFGNTLVLLSVFASKKLRTITNAFVVNLSIADLITSLMIPWNVVILLSTKEYPIKDWGCAIVAGILFTCIGTSLFTLAFIALNRLMLITQSTKTYDIVYSQFHTSIWIAATWIIPFCFNIIPPLAGVGELGTTQKYRMCLAKSSHPKKNTYDYIQVLGCFPIPLLTLIISYSWIYSYLRHHSKQMKQYQAQPQKSENNDTLTISERSKDILGSIDTLDDLGDIQDSFTSEISGARETQNAVNFKEVSKGLQTRKLKKQQTTSTAVNIHRRRKRENTITKNMFLVFIAFVVCFVPTAATLFFDESAPVVPYATALLLINACINPIIYGFKHPVFNHVFKCLITCRWKQIPEQSDAFKSLNSLCFRGFRCDSNGSKVV